MARKLTIARKKQAGVSNQLFTVYIDGQLLCINMGERRPVYAEISDNAHVITFEHIMKKFNPEPTHIPAGSENVTVILEHQSLSLFKGKWVTSVKTGE